MEPELKWSPNPETVAPDARKFEAGGKTFHKADSISNIRHGWMERLNLEASYDRTPDALFKGQLKMKEHLNKTQFFDVAVVLHDQMSAVSRIADKKEHPFIRMALLFWNYEGEDVSTMTEELMQKKVEMVGHLDVGFFFVQAASNAPGFLAAYREATRASLESTGSQGGESK